MNSASAYFLAALSAAASAFCPLVVAQAPAQTPAQAPAQTQTASLSAPQVLSLDECLKTAMEKSHLRPASRFAVAMAEAQHRQALAGYWPQVTAKAEWLRLDQKPNFLFPGETVAVPAQTVTVPGGSTTVNLPANAFGPGFPPVAVQVPVTFPNQTITTSAQSYAVGAQNIPLLNPENLVATGSATWLLFDGGMRKGYREQALGGVQVAQAEARRTDLEITDSVVRLYYGAVLARELHKVGTDALARMEVTLELTESLYKNGAGKVNKTDYLDNLVFVETIRSTVAELEKNEAMAESALAYTIGLPWNATVNPSAEEVPYRPFTGNMEELVGTAYQFNPDWSKLEAGLRAMNGEVITARSGYYPKIALTGELHKWWNSDNSGLATSANKAGWTIGGGAEIPIFDGFLTRNKVAEALAKVDKLKQERFVLREGIGLQIRQAFLNLDAAEKVYQAAKKAMTAATENRDLTARAYQSELVETEKVIRTQLFESLMTAQYLKARYDSVAIESQLSLLVGREVAARLNGK
jgi:outer membrane protein TolC